MAKIGFLSVNRHNIQINFALSGVLTRYYSLIPFLEVRQIKNHYVLVRISMIKLLTHLLTQSP